MNARPMLNPAQRRFQYWRGHDISQILMKANAVYGNVWVTDSVGVIALYDAIPLWKRP